MTRYEIIRTTFLFISQALSQVHCKASFQILFRCTFSDEEETNTRNPLHANCDKSLLMIMWPYSVGSRWPSGRPNLWVRQSGVSHKAKCERKGSLMQSAPCSGRAGVANTRITLPESLSALLLCVTFTQVEASAQWRWCLSSCGLMGCILSLFLNKKKRNHNTSHRPVQ